MAGQIPSVEFDAVSHGWPQGPLALSGVGLVARPAEVFGVLGGASAGKTVLVDLLLGLLNPAVGRIRVCGIDPYRDPVRAHRSLTFATATAAFRGRMSVESTMRFFAGLAGQTSIKSQDCLNALRLVGLPDRLIEARTTDLEPESRLFLWLAIALLRRSELVVLDDPTRNIQAEASRELQSLLSEFRAQGVAVLVATSDVLFASQVVDRIAVLRKGVVTAVRTRNQVLGLSLAQLYLDYLGELPSSEPRHRFSPEHS